MERSSKRQSSPEIKNERKNAHRELPSSRGPLACQLSPFRIPSPPPHTLPLPPSARCECAARFASFNPNERANEHPIRPTKARTSCTVSPPARRRRSPRPRPAAARPSRPPRAPVQAIAAPSDVQGHAPTSRNKPSARKVWRRRRAGAPDRAQRWIAAEAQARGGARGAGGGVRGAGRERRRAAERGTAKRAGEPRRAPPSSRRSRARTCRATDTEEPAARSRGTMRRRAGAGPRNVARRRRTTFARRAISCIAYARTFCLARPEAGSEDLGAFARAAASARGLHGARLGATRAACDGPSRR